VGSIINNSLLTEEVQLSMGHILAKIQPSCFDAAVIVVILEEKVRRHDKISSFYGLKVAAK
jgi:hypothetical protein